jgi:peptidoglycan L-alanyl-D-glutamate endopeptidase CwlK
VDQLSLDRIETLHPKWRPEVKQAYIEANNTLGKGSRLRFSYTSRSWEVQSALYAQGRESLSEINRLRKIAGISPISASEAKTIVTNAKAGESFHNYHLAFDIVIIYDNDGNGAFEEPSWSVTRDFDKDGIADWLEVTKVFTKYGFQNGFIKNGKKWDLPHFQKTFGYTIKQLQEKYRKKDFIPGTDFLNL